METFKNSSLTNENQTENDVRLCYLHLCCISSKNMQCMQIRYSTRYFEAFFRVVQIQRPNTNGRAKKLLIRFDATYKKA